MISSNQAGLTTMMNRTTLNVTESMKEAQRAFESGELNTHGPTALYLERQEQRNDGGISDSTQSWGESQQRSGGGWGDSNQRSGGGWGTSQQR